MGNESGILEVEVEINNIIKDLRSRIKNVYDKYTDDNNQIPKLPDYDVISKDRKLWYNLCKTLTECIDELLDIKVRITVVRNSINEIGNMSAPSRAEYAFMVNLRNNIKRYDEELTENKFDIMDLIKNANSKLRILDSLSWSEV